MLTSSQKTKLSKKSASIIGGMFGLEPAIHAQGETPPFLVGKEVFLNSGRSCISLVINILRPPRVWVPSYICRKGILEAIDLNVTSIRFFELDCNLNVKSNQWISEVAPGDLVILIDYFGFPFDRKNAIDVKKKGAWVLEDACQALLSGYVGKSSDFVLFSIIKWIGAPDGAVIRFPESMPFKGISLESPPAEWWLKALRASVLRREFDDGLSTREWFKLFKETEDAMPTGPYAMSELSQTIMKHSVGYSYVADRRSDNYNMLLKELTGCAIFPHLEPDVVPLGFPVRVKNRDAIRQTLFDHRIFPPVHWDIDKVVPSHYEESHQLSREIMTLPCDQRYGPEDMDKIIKAFKKAVQQYE